MFRETIFGAGLLLGSSIVTAGIIVGTPFVWVAIYNRFFGTAITMPWSRIFIGVLLWVLLLGCIAFFVAGIKGIYANINAVQPEHGS